LFNGQSFFEAGNSGRLYDDRAFDRYANVRIAIKY